LRDWNLQDRLKTGGFMTEFGAVSGREQAGIDNLYYLLDKMEERHHSWAYWSYKWYSDYTTAARPEEEEGYLYANNTVI
jgi:hypothetical protein